ncbi:LTA synthase family protein [Anaerobium acetethylicum]|uniref:Phosphoglycerol transferase MdoB n=1 Tax=Anaerobium acetethylicum TaxID=1619234 RepID=A0A1D3TQC1_9FIRM|nr:LTA synthase family protein [Anaerobium acetethylicum]SCP95754.1 Phosphoglycerol transferase MdoB [Anaerobium acetethylicum]
MNKKKKNLILTITALTLFPLFTAFMIETLNHLSMNTAFQFYKNRMDILLYTYAVALFVELAVYSISNNFLIASLSLNLIFGLLGIVDYYKWILKNEPLLPSDFFAYKACIDIAGSMNIQISDTVRNMILIFVLIIILSLFARHKITKIWARLVLLVISVIGFTGACEIIKADDSLFFAIWSQQATYQQGGFVSSFIKNMDYVHIEKPDNYTNVSIETIKKDIVMTDCNTDINPNIIMIMSESYSDLSEFGDLNTNIEATPFFNSLKEETTYGHVTVSCFGGNTCNTEYEVLTGNSMVFLPPNSIPYQQYVHKNTETLASVLNAQGYISTAIHPNDEMFWSRDEVYPLFGFSKFINIKDFIQPLYEGDYVTDETSFNKIIETFENNKGSKQFIFEVTIQNHAPYKPLTEGNTVSVGINNLSDKESVNNYLSVLNKSDKALEQLINYFRNCDEPTIIVFFGDHRPWIGAYEDLLGHSIGEMSNDEVVSYYSTPFLMWANYSMDTEQNIQLDASYMAPYVLSRIGLDMPDYFHFLLDLREEVNSIDANYVVDANGNIYRDNYPDAINDAIEDYRLLQYDRIFGKNYADE